MPIFKIKNQFLIYKGRKVAEEKYRKELSGKLIDEFGKFSHSEEKMTEIIIFSLNYYTEKFENICKSETSYTFYKNIFWFHEQVTYAVHQNLVDENLPKEISGNYIPAYRRILKFIIEFGCEIKMVSDEDIDNNFKERTELILDDLLFLGEMMMMCTDLYAEQRMIEDVAELVFDENDLYVFKRKHHYNFIFEHISEELGKQITKHVVDPHAFPDLEMAFKDCLSINYREVSHLIASIHEELGIDHGDVVAVDWETFILNMKSLFDVEESISETYFQGLKLDKYNKMSLLDLVCKPYNLNRFIYRPIIIWNIDGKDYGVLGSNAWTESLIQLSTNAIAWGKAPIEWLQNLCFKNFVHRKEDAHDKWLDDETEEKIRLINLMYDRNVKRIQTHSGSHNIDIAGLGEIDFIIISKSIKTIFIADCKHLLGRYDMVNQKNDFNAFSVGSKKNKSYNETLSNKLLWFNENKTKIEEHFQIKYSDNDLSIQDYNIEGIFIVNSPTFYMYNAEYRIYVVDKLIEVLEGKFQDKTFTIIIDEDEHQKILNIKYPYFQKPKYVTIDPFEDEEE